MRKIYKYYFYFINYKNRKRSDTRKLGKDYLKQGDYEKAKSKFVESYDVNPRMAYNFIKVKFYYYKLVEGIL